MVKYKLFYDKDAEQDWLNRLAGLGWKLESFFLGRYKFTKCEPGTYRYQIDLLNSCTLDKSDYEEFMEDAGVRVVCQWFKWVFLEKKVSEGGEFELYTDIESKIDHYRKIKRLFIAVLVIELVCLAVELMALITTGRMLFLFFTILIGAIVGVIARAVWKYDKVLTRYKLEIGME